MISSHVIFSSPLLVADRDDAPTPIVPSGIVARSGGNRILFKPKLSRKKRVELLNEISGERRLSPKVFPAFAQSALLLAYAFVAIGPTLAQDAAQPATAKWRPKEGTYASPGKGFAEACGEFGDLNVELREKSVSGHEWGCKVGKLTDTGPGAIRLDMTCSDLNLTEFLKRPEEAEFKEVLLLKKIDDKSMSARKTLDGKFKDPEWKAVYCPKEAQQMYRDTTAKNQAKIEQETAAAKTAWQPRDGVYASAGADFDDRCLKSGDAVVRLAQSALSIGGASCYVAHVSVESPNSVTLNVNCGQGVVTSNGSILGSASVESVTLSKTDGQSVLFHRSQNGQALWSDQQLRYCPEAAQLDFTESKVK
jgi:hypothetical protein